ncbi:MAG TPA: PKD domain-containing protein [Bryobacterales bacterium]|nr:PKD domain-containing protein [Bryobacterales bacterium]
MIHPLVRVADFSIGETQEVERSDRFTTTAKLLALRETRDPIRSAIRKAEVDVEIDGIKKTLNCGNYQLPVVVGTVEVDCPVTGGYAKDANSEDEPWGLDKDARLRFWPKGYPYIKPGTFVYPVNQRWFASDTQMSNEPVFVDGGELPSNKSIYYHTGLDIGGVEEMVDVIAATDGLVVSLGDAVLSGEENDTPVRARYDVIYIRDRRDWYYRYSHLHSFAEGVELGKRVRIGQKLGLLGKEGGSGGWSHLHFEIKSKQPSGKWGTQEGYAFLWNAYQSENKPNVIAVARPHHFITAGESVVLDATKSWTKSGKIASYSWKFTNGSDAAGPTVKRKYDTPGVYSEVLKITDDQGNSDYDFAVVQVIAPQSGSGPDRVPPSLHAAYSPSMGVKPGQTVSFKVRAFRTTHGEETWDFGDGSPVVSVKSDGNVEKHAKDGYALTTHVYEKPGDYIARVERTNEQGEKAIAHVHVRIEAP